MSNVEPSSTNKAALAAALRLVHDALPPDERANLRREVSELAALRRAQREAKA
jgi:hypothetical protein